MEKFDKKNLTKKKFKKKIKNFSVKFFFQFFLPNGVLRPIWGMPAKFWGARPAGLGGDRERTDNT
jgi:hypothetical protein